MAKNISYKIAWGTLLCNILILLHHANLSTYFTSSSQIDITVMNFFSSLAGIAMSYFFLITSYLFFRNFSFDNYQEKLKKRFHSIVIPYLIWNVIALILQIIKSPSIILNNTAGGVILQNFVYIRWLGGSVVNSPLWYLFRIMEYILLAPLFYIICHNNRKYFGIVIIGILVILNGVFGISYFDFTYFLPEFLFGCYLSINKQDAFENFVGNENSHNTIKAILFFAICIILACAIRPCSSLPILQCLLRFIILIPFICFMRNSKAFNFPPQLRGLGMFLYCSHDIFYRIIRNVLKNFNCDVLVLFVILFVSTMLMTTLIYLLMSKFSKKTLSILTGGR